MIDLSNNRVPFGLLTKEERDHLRNWKGGIEYHNGSPGWRSCEPCWLHTSVYRTVSPPKREELFLVWDGQCSIHMYGALTDAKEHTQKYGGTIYRITRNEDGSDPQIAVVE